MGDDRGQENTLRSKITITFVKSNDKSTKHYFYLPKVRNFFPYQKVPIFPSFSFSVTTFTLVTGVVPVEQRTFSRNRKLRLERVTSETKSRQTSLQC